MGTRRRARELAMQALFYMDVRQESLGECLPLFCRTHPPSGKSMPLFLKLVSGVVHVRSEIDAVIERFSSNWKVSRMSGVDRNILRIAVFEMLCCEDIPVKVSINEAIDIGKRFGTEESGAFINGILDSIHSAVGRQEVRIDAVIPEPEVPDGIELAADDDKTDKPPRPAPLLPVGEKKGGVVRRRKLGTPNSP
ncbi:MAG: transcription antitermination factor NusB [Desulfobacterales bacterium]|nr:transcription antitermination factor NusB [Desulfobacterales bacterium]